MPRSNRISLGGMVFHVLNRGVGRQRLFDKAAVYEAFESIIEETLSKQAMRICSYCLMPNHWHFVLWPEHDDHLAAFMQRLTVTQSQKHRRRVGEGHVYQGGFKSFPVEADDYFYQVVRYAERNALRANLVSQAEDWQWSRLWRQVHGTAAQRRGLSVSLRATTTPVPTDIMVQQGGKVLASMRITPSTSYATYDLSLSDADIAKGTTGLCHISGPLVVICETTPSCCPDGVPSTLTATFTYGVTVDCPTPCGSFTTTMTWNGSGWHGGGTFDCGIAVTADLRCIDGLWQLEVAACEFPHYGFTRMGTPVCSPFSANFGASIDSEHCCPDGSHVAGMLVSITE